MKRLYALFVFVLVAGSCLWAQIPEYATSYTISGGGNTIPFYYTGTGCRGQQLYPVGAFGSVPSGQMIDKIYFSSTTSGSQLYSNFDVRLGQANTTSLNNDYNQFAMTTCLQATNYTINRVAFQWFGIELATPFPYNPSLPLIVEINQLTSGGGSHSSVVQTTLSGAWRNFAIGYNAAAATGNGAYMLFFGFDLTYAAVPNNAGITALPSLQNGYCADTIPVTANIRNFGNNIIDSVRVTWSVNNVSQGTQWFTLGLDTMGSGNNDTVVTLGSYVFVAGNNYSVKAWTSLPNNQPDTVNNNDTILLNTGPALLGTYVIGTGSGADYPSFTAAVADLNTKGVCGNVTFNVQPGTYNEQIQINNFVGASQNAQVKFRALNGNASSVTLTWGAANATTPHTVRFNGGKWVTFEDMTILNTATTNSICFDFASNSNYNTINRCVVTTSGTTTTTALAVRMNPSITIGNTFKNSSFTGGYYAIYCYSGSTTTFGYDLTIENNVISSGYIYALYLYSYRNSKVIGNTIKGESTSIYLYGAYLLYCDNSTVERNYIYSQFQSGTIYGLFLSNCYGSLAQPMNVRNNCILSGYPGATGTTSYYGLYLANSGMINLDNNTVTKFSGTATYHAAYFTGCALIRSRNNSFVSLVGSPALFVNNAIGIVESENNNYFTNTGPLILFNGATYTTLAAHQAGTNLDLNSVNTNVSFQQPYECKHCNALLDGGGMTGLGNTVDVDSTLRSTTSPDIGATEYVLGSNFTLGPDTTVCSGTHTLEAGPAQSVLWLVGTTPSTGSSVTLNNTSGAPLNYTVVVNVNTLYCGSGTDTVQVRLVPNATLAPTAHICAGENLTLAPGGGSTATHAWSTGANTPSIVVNSAGTYTVTKSEEGCESTASIAVTQSTAVSINDIEGCEEDGPVSVDATIPDGFSYAWSGGSSINTAVNTFDATGNFTVTATDAFGCVSTDEFSVSILDEPQAVITKQHYANYVQFSSQGSIFTTPNSTYFWTFGDGNTSTLPNPGHAYAWIGEPTTYNVSLEITNICGTGIQNLTLTIDPLGVDDVTSGTMRLYPNPADDRVLLSFGSMQNNLSIRITDLTGRVMLAQHEASAADVLISLGGLAAGNYVVTAVSDSETFTGTLVVK